jgi:hypothetical protein
MTAPQYRTRYDALVSPSDCPEPHEYYLNYPRTGDTQKLCRLHALEAVRNVDWRVVVIDLASREVVSGQCVHDMAWRDSEAPVVECYKRAMYRCSNLEQATGNKVYCAFHVVDFIDQFGEGFVSPLAFRYL